MSLVMGMLMLAAPHLAGADTTEDPRSEADKAYAASDWVTAEAGYEAIAARSPEDAQVWFRLGRSRYELGEHETAAAAFARADGLGFAPPFTRYELARARAGTGDGAAAVDMLRQAAEAGYANPSGLDDEVFARIRTRPEFEEITERVEQNAVPCEHDPRYRQFDFWLGTWDVYGPGGMKAGTNRIEKDLGGCLLVENWTSASGGTGRSLNYYDPALDRWRQVWVDAQGGNILSEGGLRDGGMYFEGANVSRDGSSERFRMTFTPSPDGSVRQFIEQSRDGGETWYVWFDGRYVRQE
jgi:tetratricopeptide (TPR) repeat protein